MTHRNSPRAAHSADGPMLAVFLVFLALASIWLFMQRRWWLPELASIHGADIDQVFLVTLVISGVLFVLLQGVLAYFAFRYGERRSERARYWIRPAVEKRFALMAGVVIFGVDVTIFALGESQWFKAWGPSPEGTPVIEVMAEQFAWNFRYTGPDGIFGRTDAMLISSTNPFGIDKNDPSNADDIISINQLHVAAGKPVRLRLHSHDVIHSFFLPHQRVKQDAVPGMKVEIWFVPNRAGQYEIACSQLCGLGHYRMQGQLTVEPQEAFDKWLREAANGGI